MPKSWNETPCRRIVIKKSLRRQNFPFIATGGVYALLQNYLSGCDLSRKESRGKVYRTRVVVRRTEGPVLLSLKVVEDWYPLSRSVLVHTHRREGWLDPKKTERVRWVVPVTPQVVGKVFVRTVKEPDPVGYSDGKGDTLLLFLRSK